MAPGSRSQLGESWVIDDGDQDPDSGNTSSPSDQHEVSSRHSPRGYASRRSDKMKPSKPTPHSSTFSEPNLIMPTLDHQSYTSLPSPKLPRNRKAPSSTRTVSSRPVRPNRPPLQEADQSAPDSLLMQTVHLLYPVATWVYDILSSSLYVLKKPLSLVLALYLFGALVVMTQNLLTSSIYVALSPICRIPGVFLLHLPICEYTSSSTDAPRITSGSSSAPVEFDELMKTQAHFEEILADSAAGVSLPMDMKRSETSIRDLRQIVRFSQLQSRNELGLEFDGFIETARLASYDLQKFNSHVGRGVDIVLSTARWTEKVLDDLSVKQASRGIVPTFFLDTLLAPFKPVQFTESRLLDQYIQHTRIVAEEIERLIDEAQALLLLLQNLEDRLDVMHGIAMHDNIAAQATKDEILAQLWTALGGNRGQLGKVNKQLSLLKQVGTYRKVAWAHVSATILKLQAMGAELEELRTRVGSAELLKNHKEIPLSVHIESIRLGVERLEAGRDKARKLEQSHIRRVVDGVDDHIKALGSE
ncbi:hypothetical protein PV10_04865 [Exophiala mesophila]|uniref:Uncharacterized protein n=1 Tax=Exophiala mesophila TaxID=212818 RepID=A0A0D1WWB6_EXOME|nr:uncharacterized protein PV10_04865 [Exophiala mesophila]KIV93670.1 hypothetical protein PV10_04865 [Exophiala mesophila]